MRGHALHSTPAPDIATTRRSPRTIRYRLTLVTACLASLLVPGTVLAAPTITGVSPGTSTVGGGAFVQITGTGFVAGATVTFGGVPATAVQVTSATLIKCRTPAHAFGFVSVAVTNPNTTPASLPNALQYMSSGTPPPATIGDFAIPTGGSSPSDITAGPDGNLWFVESATNKIGKSTTAVVPSLREFTIPTANSNPSAITAGPDGNLWFTEGAGKIGTLATSGIFNEFTLPAGDSPIGITAGPDGNLWFTDAGTKKIGRITPTGAVTEFPSAGTTALPAFFITAGPDGNLWFTEADVFSQTSGKIGRLTTAGVLTEFSLAAGPLAIGITAGPDGNLWFSEASRTSSQIGRITPGGVITEFPLPTARGFPEEIAAGPDGDLWFTENGADRVGKVDPATGTMAEFPAATNGQPYGITLGPDGNLWLTEFNSNRIGRLRIPAPAIAGFGPPSGTVAGGTTLTITGTAFSPDATVTIGGAGVAAVTITPTQITARTLPHAAGAASVTVTNGDGKAATLTGGFSYTSVTSTTIPAVQEFADPGAIFTMGSIVLGPDGNLWFADGSVCRITPAGVITRFSTAASAIAVGPDGNLWAIGLSVRELIKVSVAGVALHHFSVPSGELPTRITAGPDGNLWYTDFSGNHVVRFDPATAAFTEFPLPTPNATPFAIAVGPDGNLWFTEGAVDKIGRLDPATGVITEFSSPIPSGALPRGIAAGPDGNLWVTELNGGIDRVTPSGSITRFPIPQAQHGPENITAGTDGALWFADADTSDIGRITTNGTVTDFPTPTAASRPEAIGIGPDGDVWFTETGAKQIGVVFAVPPTVTAISPTSGPANATQAVTITGMGFASSGVSIRFGGIPATDITVVSPTTINCTAPALPPGTVDVAVTIPNSITGTKHGYTYGAPTSLPNPDAQGGTPGSPNTLPNARAAVGPPGAPNPLPNPRP